MPAPPPRTASDFEALLPEAARSWYAESRRALSSAPEAALRRTFVAARRKVGSASLDVALPGTWRVDLLARVALLVAATPLLPVEAQRDLVGDLYVRGELEERRAVLRALPYLPNPDVHLPLAVEACRTNAKDMFEAIACENAYPARHFEELAFNQMVLKGLFMNVDASRIDGLTSRITVDLLRMIDDFEAELRSAGRPLPSGMTWIRQRAG